VTVGQTAPDSFTTISVISSVMKNPTKSTWFYMKFTWNQKTYADMYIPGHFC
jgi:hypothetical protein